MPLSEKERQQINTLVASFEADTGIQIVAAITRKADVYPEIPWKAYAMGSAIGAIAAAVTPPFVSVWPHASLIAFDAMLILGAGALFAISAFLIPAIGRLFLDRTRAQTEARQHAQVLFLDRGLSRTADRRAVLVLLCRFERLAVVLADVGLAPYALPYALLEIARQSSFVFARSGAVPAFENAFTRLKALLPEKEVSGARSARNELPDDIVLEKDA